MSEKIVKPLSSPPAKPKPKQTLTFYDGLYFGLGFFVAGFFFSVCIIPFGAVVFLLFLQSLGGLLGPLVD